MNKQEFGTQIKRLQNHWGEGSYQGETITIFWNELGHVSADKFEKAVTQVISTYLNKNYPAGLDKILMALAELREPVIDTRVPSRFNTNAGYKKTENGATEKQTNQQLGSILKNLLN
ncbi:MAG: hypothetical protein CL529_11960 [Aequorivita sp.]|nr:hypothetical protein [Aequorivita sp.]|tara:strand:+ start:28696 stop:29046 length:351 start_codon:yes stop_codon:yes gene_type:complete